MSDPIERLEGELARLGAEHEPKPGWQARVLAAAEKPARRPWWQFAIPALVVAAAVVAIVFAVRREPVPKPEALALAVEIDAGSAVVRGTAAKVGDVVRATAKGGTYRAVWIYRDDKQLVAACPGGSTCTATATALTAEAKLEAPGTYTVIALDADAPLAAPTSSLDASLANAQTRGARTRSEMIDVR